jgi:phosphatidylglycerol:prolipoprotein diacylglycerol transferase
MLPILYQSSDLILYSYPLFMGLGWGIAYQIFFGLQEKDAPRIQVQIIFWGIFLSAWLGSKILFYLTMPPLEQNILTNVSFWTGGGFVFYGGLLASILFLLILKLTKFPLTEKNFWPTLPALTFGHAIGRVGCLLAGCCYGKETNWIWGIQLHDHLRHPTQIIEAVGLLILGFHLLKTHRPRVKLLSEYFMGYGVLRFCVELLRGDEIRGLWWTMTPSEWISIFLFILGLSLLLRVKYFSRLKVF